MANRQVVLGMKRPLIDANHLTTFDVKIGNFSCLDGSQAKFESNVHLMILEKTPKPQLANREEKLA